MAQKVFLTYFGGNRHWVRLNIKETQKPNSSRDLKESQGVKSLLKVYGGHYPFLSMMSLIVLTASKIVFLVMKAFWSWWTKYGRTFSNLFAIAFEPILMSTFTRDIGLQCFINRLSLSFFSTMVIKASFCEGDNSPWT